METKLQSVNGRSMSAKEEAARREEVKKDSRTRKMICFIELAMAMRMMSQDFTDNPYARGEFKRRGLMLANAATSAIKAYRHEFLKVVRSAPDIIESHMDEMEERSSFMYDVAWIFSHLGTEAVEAFAQHIENFASKLRGDKNRVCHKCGTQVYHQGESVMCASCECATTAVTIEDYQLAESIIIHHGFRVSDEPMPRKGTAQYQRWMAEHMALVTDFIDLVDSKRILGVNAKLEKQN